MAKAGSYRWRRCSRRAAARRSDKPRHPSKTLATSDASGADDCMTWARLVALCVLVPAAFADSARAEPTPQGERPIQVMILGVYHFGNPGRDLHNVQAEDVTTPRRQA